MRLTVCRGLSALVFTVLLLALLVPFASAAKDTRIGVTYSGYMPIDSYGRPQVSEFQTLLYLYEAAPPVGDAWGTYELHEVNMITMTDTVTDVFISDGNISLLDNGAVFVMVGDDDYYGMYWNISDEYRRDTRLKDAEGHDDYTLVFTEWMLSYNHVFAYNANTGKSNMVTSVELNHDSPRISGNTVIYERFGEDWDIYCSDVSGGPERAISAMAGDETCPLIDGNLVVFAHDEVTGSALYVTDIYGNDPFRISTDAGNYAVNNGHVLYFDIDESEWVVYCPESGCFHVFGEAMGNVDTIAVSDRWVCIGGMIYRLYDAPSPILPSTETVSPTPAPTDVPATTSAPTTEPPTPAPTTPPPLAEEEGTEPIVYVYVVGILALAAFAAWYVGVYAKKR